MSPQQLLSEGQLHATISQLNKTLKAQPSDHSTRAKLAELLCIQGEFDTADAHFSQLCSSLPTLSPAITTVRQLIRAEQARINCYRTTQFPQFFSPPDAELKIQLEALMEYRAGQHQRAKLLIHAMDKQSQRLKGEYQSQIFSGIRDLDDLCNHHLEILSAQGEYFWLPFNALHHIKFHSPKSTLDLIWRTAELSFKKGGQAKVVVPAIYVHSYDSPLESLRIGQSTDWLKAETAPTRGLGLRMFLIGKHAYSINEIQHIHFQEPE